LPAVFGGRQVLLYRQRNRLEAEALGVGVLRILLQQEARRDSSLARGLLRCHRRAGLLRVLLYGALRGDARADGGSLRRGHRVRRLRRGARRNPDYRRDSAQGRRPDRILGGFYAERPMLEIDDDEVESRQAHDLRNGGVTKLHKGADHGPVIRRRVSPLWGASVAGEVFRCSACVLPPAPGSGEPSTLHLLPERCMCVRGAHAGGQAPGLVE